MTSPACGPTARWVGAIARPIRVTGTRMFAMLRTARFRPSPEPPPRENRLRTGRQRYGEIYIGGCRGPYFGRVICHARQATFRQYRIRPSSSVPSDRKTTTLSIRFMNSGVNFRRAASIPALVILASRSPSVSPEAMRRSISHAANPRLGLRMALISAVPRLLVMKIIAREKSTRLLSPKLSVALSRTPKSRFHNASLAFSISSNYTKLILI